ncbi:VanR-ABDEGLN family response regulator transcription factor [Clostridium senegalense]|uniref:VanR-ABDEGLN family response regulator transcription factor n=1 Tax=Clostridium senegalense TaxID=1465809 RepID=UPI003CC811B4
MKNERSTKNLNVLLVDDEQSIADLVEVYLQNDNYNVYKFYTGKEALRSLDKVDFDLAILDVMLPDIDGFKICKIIREKYFFPIIMLTAKIEDIDKITGLTLGADDYLTKPFNPLELLARVKSQLRRYKKYNKRNSEDKFECEKSEYDFHGLIINNDNHKCSLYGKTITLTPIEFSILWYLCENKGRVVSSEELFESVWKEKYLDNNNTVMAHVARLREKMNEPSRKPKFIKTVWGVGYTIE